MGNKGKVMLRLLKEWFCLCERLIAESDNRVGTFSKCGLYSINRDLADDSVYYLQRIGYTIPLW